MNEKLLAADFDLASGFPSLSRRLRLGIVGGGRISQVQTMAARLCGYWEITAGALSSDPEKCKSKGKKWHLPDEKCYSSYTDMARLESARADGIDAVMITTPNHLHYPVAKCFMEAGIHVLCDKPMTNNLDEAKDLIEIQKKTGAVFGVGYVMSAFPMIRQAKQIVESGGVGKINQIHVEFMQDWMIPENINDADHVKWRLDPKQSGATSCVGDIGTHAAHLSEFVSGLSITDLRTDFYVCGAPKALEDTFFMHTKYNNVVPGTLMATRFFLNFN